MRGKIVVTSQDGNVQEIPMDRPTMTVGRKPGNDLHFNRPEISGTHASFTFEDGQYFITDLGSTNGTLLNGAQLIARQKYSLQHKDVVTVAPYTFTFLMEVETSETIVEAPAPSLEQPPPIRSGTIVDPHARISTGTEENVKEEMEREMKEMAAAAAPSPVPAPEEEAAPEPEAPSAAEATPEPAPEPKAEPAPAPKPKPKPKPAPPPAADDEEEAESEPPAQAETKTAISDYAWLGIGALFLITAILLIVYVIMGL